MIIPMQDFQILPAGDSSVLIQFEQRIDPQLSRRVTAAAELIRARRISGLVDMIPAYCSLLISYDPRVIRYDPLIAELSRLLETDVASAASRKRIVELPVCYGGELGPDLEKIAQYATLSTDEVIRIHTSADYLVYMLGFLPGFAYLGGMDPRIHTPRLPEPRIRIPAGSVGIGGSQTGVYPLDSPGGWNLMGRTPVRTYDPARSEPILLQAGDTIRFVSIDRNEYDRILSLVERGEYTVTVHEEEV